jgi:crossover junction endonuclease MUS81
MKTLESKELVCTKGHPTKRYYLSDEGWEIAKRMKEVNGDIPFTSQSITKGKKQERQTERRLVQHRDVAAKPSGRAKDISARGGISVHEVLDLSSDSETADDPKSSLQPSLPAARGNFASHPSSTTVEDTILLPPDSFDIRLVLDTREIRTVTDRDYISGELKKLGVAPVIRSLPLGDVLWVAHVKDSYAPRLKAQNLGDAEDYSDEIVLDHIMERKRLDDLIGSIKDGRFNEQKFRLKKSGIRNVTYLIEEYSISAEKGEKYGEAVDSVIASMQVVSDIFVKRTSMIDHTIRYLARMTKSLQNLYKKKGIRVIPSTSLDEGSYLDLLGRLRGHAPDITFGTTFSAFASMCDKSDNMTLRDVYLKMLLCIRGVTPDKAVEIQKLWPTPRSFIEAFEAQTSSKDKDDLVSKFLGDAIPKKKVGKTLSAKIAEVWG